MSHFNDSGFYCQSMKAQHTKIDLNDMPCLKLTGVGKRIAERLAHLGVHSVQDLLFYLPSKYQDRTRIVPIRQLRPGDHVVIEGTVESVSAPYGGKTRLLCTVQDDTGRLHVRFFHVTTYQRQQWQQGARVRCFGEIRYGVHALEIIHPEYYLVHPDQETMAPVETTLTPIYPTTEGLSQLMLRKLTEQALQFLTAADGLLDMMPEHLLQQFTFPTLKEALHYVHRPPADAPVDLLMEGKHITQRRLVFEELLAHRLSLLFLKQQFQVQKAMGLPLNHHYTAAFLKSLPFQLTKAQQQVAAEIHEDMLKPSPMLRLVQGDVGSGKTVVAALAILQAVENRCQAAILAPTELLVEQHFKTFDAWFKPLNISVVMLSGQMKAVPRREALAAISNGTAQVILGTHAIFQKEVEFSNLALIVVDEQHRFGVEQRARLREKGMNDQHCPHQLIMTATPIPRTLAMSVYADLDYSIIDELPPGRTPVSTLIISSSRRAEVLEKIHHACAAGRQAYWVCTLIEESEVLQCQAAENTALELQTIFNELKIGLIHGRMKTADKDAVMTAFKKGDIHLLVATTVIEVGVDVPNASLMVVENAERLGLAQLHQLRGRVGRGTIVSHCVLMYYPPLSYLAKERLKIMRETTDGFKIAQRDLELRGPGEVLGTRQTGDVTLRIANLVRDSDLLPAVQQAATLFQNEYNDRIYPLIKRWLNNKEKFGNV